MFHTQKDADRIAAPSQLFWYVERRRGNQRRKKNFFSPWPFLPQDQDGYNRREERLEALVQLESSRLLSSGGMTEGLVMSYLLMLTD